MAQNATTDPSEVTALISIFKQWDMQALPISGGERCIGFAINGSEFEKPENNPATSPNSFFKITSIIATWYIVLGLDLSVLGYLNSKQAALFKRLIWEAMNKDYDKGKRRKRARMAKKAAPAKKPEKAVKVSTVMDTKNRLSSKFNYEALDNLNEELGYAPAFEEGTKSNCGSLGDMQLSNEEAEARQVQDDDSYVGNDKYNGYNYDDECNYDEECDFEELT
ncbi:hypothetical protein L3X38_029047 [Prunus dulcis]|uniref:Brf1 TBP-binding domain-containing protein n=1 Tax=Prunus dulcis TaxID=3755 RepID=A0AAD4Z1T3_PRUDU|nr:hypothetical protein L3X38_029047 [Prunus dulcis]